MLSEGKSSNGAVSGQSRTYKGNRNNPRKRNTKETSDGGQNEGIKWMCIYPQKGNATGSMKDGIRPKVGLSVETTWKSKPFHDDTKAERKQQVPIEIRLGVDREEESPYSAAAASPGLLFNRTLWIGNLTRDWDEKYIHNFITSLICGDARFSQRAPPVLTSVKLIRNKSSGNSSGYAFLEFPDHEAASVSLESLKDQLCMAPEQKATCSVNWAVDRRCSSTSENLSLFVGDLPRAVSDSALHTLFSSRYGDVIDARWYLHAVQQHSLKSALKQTHLLRGGLLDHASQQSAKYSTFQSPIKPTASPSCYFLMEMCNIPFNRVIVDPKTGSSRGFGFVTFGNAPDRNAALITMNGAMCLGNPIRVAPAIGKKGTTDRGSSTTLSPTAAFKVVGGAEAEMHTIRTAGADRGREAGSRGGGGSSPPPSAGCTIFVGGLNYSVTEEMLWNRFSPFGSVDYVKVPPGRDYGFVAFWYRTDAEKAIASLQGAVVGSCKIRLTWGKTQQDKILDWNNQQQAACFYSQPFTYQYEVQPQIGSAYYLSTPRVQSEVLAAEQQLDLSASNYGGLYTQTSPLSPSPMTYSMYEKQQCRVMNCLTTGAETYCLPSLSSVPTNMYIDRIEYIPQGFYTTSPPLQYYSVAENGGLRNRPISMDVLNAEAGAENLAGGATPLNDGKGSSGSSDSSSSVVKAQETEAVYANSDILPSSSSPVSEFNASKQQPQLSASHVYSSPVAQESSTTRLSQGGGSLMTIEHGAELSAAMTQLKVEGREDLCTREIHA